MHELSIAVQLVESLENELASHDEYIVDKVNIRVGSLSGVEPEALQFCWEVASNDSRLQGSTLFIETVNASGYCPQCKEERVIRNLQSFRCPVCYSPITQITGGHELEILTIEVLEPDEIAEPVQE